MQIILEVSALENAIGQLEEALQYCASDLAATDKKLALHLRAGAIQAFEFTYELTLKMLKRYLTLTTTNPNIVNEMSFNELIRMGYAKGLLLSELVAWKGFRQDRGTTSHTYNEIKAQDVFENIPVFLKEAQYLVEQLKKRQQSSVD